MAATGTNGDKGWPRRGQKGEGGQEANKDGHIRNNKRLQELLQALDAERTIPETN